MKQPEELGDFEQEESDIQEDNSSKVKKMLDQNRRERNLRSPRKNASDKMKEMKQEDGGNASRNGNDYDARKSGSS